MSSGRLFESDDLALTYAPQRGRKPLVVTFNPRHPTPSTRFPGFGEAFLAKYGYPAAHVTAGRNHWYQVDDMEPVLELLRVLAGGHDRVVTYGSSMGAHAALLFANRLGARAIAFSPLYSVDPAVAPFERRYAADVDALRFRYGPAELAKARGDVIYDPLSADARHAALLRGVGDFRFLPLPFSGHPTTTYLAETGHLSRLARQLIEGRAPVVLAQARAARRGSARYWRTLSILARRRGRDRLAVIAARRAVRLAPADLSCRRALALAEGRAAAG
jgi:pimeloyl-ACP methyl ester carboxylesterase